MNNKLMNYFCIWMVFAGTNILLPGALAERSFFIMNKTNAVISQKISIDGDEVSVNLEPDCSSYAYKLYKDDAAAAMRATIPSDPSVPVRNTEIILIVFAYDAARCISACTVKWRTYNDLVITFLKKQKADLTARDSLEIGLVCFNRLELDTFFREEQAVPDERTVSEGMATLWSLVKKHFQPITGTPFYVVLQPTTPEPTATGERPQQVEAAASRRLASTV